MRQKLTFSCLMLLLLVSCAGGEATETVPAEEVPVVSQTEGQVIAEAFVEPDRWAELRAPADGGNVIEVAVKEGDKVAEGDVLVRLDPTDAELAVQQAEAALALAEARLMQVKAGARPEEIAVTEAHMKAAEAALAQAAARRDQFVEGKGEIDVASAKAAVAAAEAEYKQAYNLHERTLKCVEVTIPIPGAGKRTICPALGPPEEQARAAMQAAEGRMDAAQKRFEASQNQAQAQLRDARAGVQSAEAEQEALQARLELQKAGSSAEQIAAVEAEVAKAGAALAAAQERLEDIIIRAPFDGTVAELPVDAGDTVAPGQVLVVLATLDQLQVRTKDLTELDVVRLAVDQRATVTLDALPDQPITGHVARIDGQSEDYRGDVTYPVIVELDEDVSELRWGMTALVEIAVE